MSTRIYISGALMAARDLASARARYEACADILRSEGFSPYLPHQNTDPKSTKELSSIAVFERDMQALRDADAVVAFLDEPSLGVGAELATCIANEVPILALMFSGARVSRFTLGMLEQYRLAETANYQDAIELRAAMRALLPKLLLSKNGSLTLKRRAPIAIGAE